MAQLDGIDGRSIMRGVAPHHSGELLRANAVKRGPFFFAKRSTSWKVIPREWLATIITPSRL